MFSTVTLHWEKVQKSKRLNTERHREDKKKDRNTTDTASSSHEMTIIATKGLRWRKKKSIHVFL